MKIRSISILVSVVLLITLHVSSIAVIADVSFSETHLAGPSSAVPPEVNARAYVLYDDTTHTFLLGSNQDEKLSPASITKVLTVLLALENMEMSDTITITKEMFQDIPNDYVRLGLMEGEIITVEQALYGCMLNSCNDAAMAIALSLADSVENFSLMMNERAAELGCIHTNFTNPFGYADPQHLTSAHDMAIIMAEAVKHDKFTEIALTRYYSMDPTNILETHRGMPNGNKLIPKGEFAYEYFIGGKTGYTVLSGNTLVAGARKDGRTLIAVILGAPLTNSRYEDTRALFDYGFSEYVVIEPSEADFSAVKNNVLNELDETITTGGLAMNISGSELEITDSLTVAATQGTSASVDYEAGEINDDPDPALTTQTIEYPLLCSTSENYEVRVGTLKVMLEAIPPVSQANDTEKEKGRSAFAVVLQILASILLAVVIVVILLILFALIQRKLKRHRRRTHKRPPAH